MGSASRTCAPSLGVANANQPKGIAQDRRSDTTSIGTTDQLLHGRRLRAARHRCTRTAHRCASSDVATGHRLGRGHANGGIANGKPAILMIIFRQPGANIIETVDRIKALLPQLQASIPPAIDSRS